MASTRNKNTFGNYCLERKQDENIRNYPLYKHSGNGEAYSTKLAGVGLLMGTMAPNLLAYNHTDIESFLRGVGSNNLEEMYQKQTPIYPTFTPEPKRLQTQDLFELPKIYMPEPLVVPKNQRPFAV